MSESSSSSSEPDKAFDPKPLGMVSQWKPIAMGPAMPTAVDQGRKSPFDYVWAGENSDVSPSMNNVMPEAFAKAFDLKKIETEPDNQSESKYSQQIANVRISVPVEGFEIPYYKQRREHRMKEDPSKTKLALKAILDQWVACTISVDDAETKLRELLASRPTGAIDVEIGGLLIKSNGMPFNGEFKLDGHDIGYFDKLTLTCQVGKCSRIVIEGPIIPKPSQPAESV